MKKIFRKCIAGALSVLMLAGCSGTGSTAGGNPGATASNGGSTADTKTNNTLKVWSFTNEANVFVTDFKKKNPDVNIEFTMVPMTNGEYQTKLQQTLADGSDAPDVVFLEVSFLRQYVESGFLASLDDLKPKADALKTYGFTLQAGTNPDGELKAVSYQATPGALFYRRSLAKEYLGTDDPAEVQKQLADFTKFDAAAKTIKEKSGGNTYMVASSGDFTQTFFSNKSQPWVVDDKMVIDPIIDQLWEVAKNFRQEGYEARAKQWEEGWFAGMSDTLKDASGQPKKVFCYFLPTWGLPYVLMQNAKTETTDTSGDWGVIPGPLPYQWGGTWLSIPKDAKNPELAKKFVEFATLDEETLTNWATGVYTNDYLKAIDPSIADQFQGPGDFVSSQVVVDKIKDSFSNSDTSKFIGGQNSYVEFSEVAPTIQLDKIQGTDDAIQRAMQDAMETYVNGSASKEDAMKNFKAAVKTVLPDIQTP